MIPARQSDVAPGFEASTVTVTHRTDAYFASRLARNLAASAGFDRTAEGEIGIVVMELASNVIEHAGGGELRVRLVEDAARGVGLEIIAADEGPPFRDLSLALRDGHDDRGPIAPEALVRRRGLGSGLGAVLRMTHTFQHEPTPRGKSIRVVRYRRWP